MPAFLSPSRGFFVASFLVSAAVLTTVLVAQYGFGLQPCELCHLERVPFVAVGVLSALMVLLPTSRRLRVLGVGLVTLAFLADTLLAGYHIGVEQHWWASAVCTATTLPTNVTPGDLSAAFSHAAPPPSCDTPRWWLFGITLAGYNGLLAVALTVLSALALSRSSKP